MGVAVKYLMTLSLFTYGEELAAYDDYIASSDMADEQNRKSRADMRGFDPASEDDMDDNGVGRYTENTDDEGWD